MGTADEGLWPRATEAARARWAAQAVEPYLHMARIIMSRAAAGPAGETPFPRASPRPRAAALRRDRTPSRCTGPAPASGRARRPPRRAAGLPYPHLAGWAPAEGRAPRQDRRLAMAYLFGIRVAAGTAYPEARRMATPAAEIRGPAPSRQGPCPPPPQRGVPEEPPGGRGRPGQVLRRSEDGPRLPRAPRTA
jgi:hypothetical protein